MIGRLRGVVLEKQPPLILLETGGIGYEAYMPMTCFYKLPDIGKETIIFTHFIIRENVQLLYGFNNKQERMLFRELIKTNGIGPKLALTILSFMSSKQFINTINREDLSALSKLPGIGKKTAKRLIIEMKDYFNDLHHDQICQTENLALTTPSVSFIEDTEQEAIAALIALGYKSQEAIKMVNKVSTPSSNSNTLIRNALRSAL